jgi:hypothetical protein
MMKFSLKPLLLVAGLALANVGCFYPPTTEPPADEQERTVVALPFDVTWNMVNSVAKREGLRVEVADPNNHNLEASGPRFTLQQADCGTIKSIAGQYAAQPEAASTSVYNILIKPHGREHTLVAVAVSYNSPVRVPLHPATDVDCISRGTDESRFLKEIIAEATITPRPDYRRQEAPAAAAAPAASSTEAAQPEQGSTVRRSPLLIDPKSFPNLTTSPPPM